MWKIKFGVYYNKQITSARMQAQPELCRIPKFINFEYHQGQQLNTTILIDNLTDKVVDYKIKSNKPQLFLVKPMEGSIYKRENVKIVFKRKQLGKTEFQAYLRNPTAIQEKFLIEIKCNQQDVMGVEKTITQTAIALVKFNLENKQPEAQIQMTSDEKRQQVLEELNAKIMAKSGELKRLELQEFRVRDEEVRPKQQRGITKLDIINLVVIFFLLGMAFGV